MPVLGVRLFGVLFVLSRVPTLVAQLSAFARWSDVTELLADTPGAGVLTGDRAGEVAVTPLGEEIVRQAAWLLASGSILPSDKTKVGGVAKASILGFGKLAVSYGHEHPPVKIFCQSR